MIEINLLPEDLKRRARAGGSRQRTAVLCALLVAVAAGAVGYFHFTRVGARRALNRRLSERLASLRRDIDELATLETAIKHIEKRKRALSDLYADRTLWAEKLDQLVDIVPDNVWIRSIRLAAPRRSQLTSTSGGSLILECYSAGEKEEGITIFRERLRQHEAFFKDVADMNPISHRRREFPAYVEGVALDFTVDLQLKSRTPVKPTVPQRRTRTVSAPR